MSIVRSVEYVNSARCIGCQHPRRCNPAKNIGLLDQGLPGQDTTFPSSLRHIYVEVRHSTEEIVNTLFILLTTLNTLGKQVAFNVRTARIDRIINTINGSLFASCNEYHDDIMKRNAAAMRRLLRSYHCAIFLCAIMWTIYPVVNRILGEDVHFSGYFPYDTSQPPVFALTVAYMSILITLQAYGNVTMDCTIVAFYAQAKTQLQMLRFVKEIESIFGEAMVVQFFVMAWVICMTVYKIVGLAVLSAEFCSMAIYLGCMLAQLFIYCYGTQLKYESECINQSIYECEWMSLSPAMRRQLLVLMVRSSRPLAPCIAYIVPMSIETYISILKSSYTLFTFLDRK